MQNDINQSINQVWWPRAEQRAGDQGVCQAVQRAVRHVQQGECERRLGTSVVQVLEVEAWRHFGQFHQMEFHQVSSRSKRRFGLYFFFLFFFVTSLPLFLIVIQITVTLRVFFLQVPVKRYAPTTNPKDIEQDIINLLKQNS